MAALDLCNSVAFIVVAIFLTVGVLTVVHDIRFGGSMDTRGHVAILAAVAVVELGLLHGVLA